MSAATAELEGVDAEHKARFTNSDRERWELAKIIVSFANTNGSIIRIEQVDCKHPELDSARIDDLVNSCIEPRLNGITSRIEGSKAFITVPKSTSQPHIISQTKSYINHEGNQRPAFHQGQIFVRHSSKTEPATADDLANMLQERLTALFTKVGEAFQAIAHQIKTSDASFAVSISGEGLPLSITLPDLNVSHPWTTKRVAKELKKNTGWVAKAMSKLGLRSDRRYCYTLLVTNNKAAVTRYSDLAIETLRAHLESHPEFNPYQ